MLRLIGCGILGMALTGCATQYQSTGLTGGHAETKGPGKLELVQFFGNGFTPAELTQKYAIYRCAELADKNRKPFFMMFDSLIGAADERPTSAPRVGLALNKPISTVYVLMLDAPRPGAQETRRILETLRPVIEAGSLAPKT